MASTTSLCAPSPLFTWMWASSYDFAPFLREAFEGLLGIAVAKLGACVAPRCALGEDVDGGVKPDGDRPIVEKLASPWVHEGAPAGCDHAHIALNQACDQASLAVPEIPLAIAFENFGRRVAGGIFNRGVAVDEVEAEPLCQAPSDGRFADAHQADEDHRTVKALAEIGHL